MGRAFLKGIMSKAERCVSRAVFYSVRKDSYCTTQLSEVLGHCHIRDIFWT